jgi:hypothetical protein
LPRPDGCPFDWDEEEAQPPFSSQQWDGFRHRLKLFGIIVSGWPLISEESP